MISSGANRKMTTMETMLTATQGAKVPPTASITSLSSCASLLE